MDGASGRTRDPVSERRPEDAAVSPWASGGGLRTTLPLVALIGVLAGIGGYTVSYADGLSYLSADPKACANCHLMQEHFEDWLRGSHSAVATCNDCHVPSRFPANLWAKAVNGYHHSVGITLQSPRPDEPGARRVFREPIGIKPANSRVLQANCLRCHGEVFHGLGPGDRAWSSRSDEWHLAPGFEGHLACVHCHASVGHAARR